METRVHGSRKNRRVTVGQHGKLTPELARRKAKAIIADMAMGIDPVIEKASTEPNP